MHLSVARGEAGAKLDVDREISSAMAHREFFLIFGPAK